MMHCISFSWAYSKSPWVCMNLWWPCDSHSFPFPTQVFRLHHRETELSSLFSIWKLTLDKPFFPFPFSYVFYLMLRWELPTGFTVWAIHGFVQLHWEMTPTAFPILPVFWAFCWALAHIFMRLSIAALISSLAIDKSKPTISHKIWGFLFFLNGIMLHCVVPHTSLLGHFLSWRCSSLHPPPWRTLYHQNRVRPLQRETGTYPRQTFQISKLWKFLLLHKMCDF